MDLTGKYILRGEFKETETIFWTAHNDVITDLKPAYLNTSIHWLDKEHQTFNAVIIPMKRDGNIIPLSPYNKTSSNSDQREKHSSPMTITGVIFFDTRLKQFEQKADEPIDQGGRDQHFKMFEL